MRPHPSRRPPSLKLRRAPQDEVEFRAAKRVGRNSEAYCAVWRKLADYASLIRPTLICEPPPHEHHRRAVRERGGEHLETVLLVEADVARAFVGDEVQAGQLRVFALRREGLDQRRADTLAARRRRDIDVQVRGIGVAQRAEGRVIAEIGKQRSAARVLQAAGEIADDGFRGHGRLLFTSP